MDGNPAPQETGGITQYKQDTPLQSEGSFLPKPLHVCSMNLNVTLPYVGCTINEKDGQDCKNLPDLEAQATRIKSLWSKPTPVAQKKFPVFCDI